MKNVRYEGHQTSAPIGSNIQGRIRCRSKIMLACLVLGRIDGVLRDLVVSDCLAFPHGCEWEAPFSDGNLTMLESVIVAA